MMVTLTPTTTTSTNGDELLLITQPALRTKLLHARMVDEFSANSVIQRGEKVYLSLRNVADEALRREITWAILRLQMGATLKNEEIPDPLRTALQTAASGPSPLLMALMVGGLSGVVGGVMIMAFVGLIVTILNVSAESYVGVTATAVAFVLGGALFGISTTIFVWRRLSHQKTAVPPFPFNFLNSAKTPK
ncbi:MAG: hypothetical protein H6657_27565 [Ardenticatenaceae bacterium]|nr:hypothetical protein [Anaerolineales bacterium]MCB8981180.1 hypothetical protein [Ardenticatenaceae bacterium]